MSYTRQFLPCDYNLQYCERISARPFVCLSVKRLLCDKTKEICAQIFIPHERWFIPDSKNGW